MSDRSARTARRGGGQGRGRRVLLKSLLWLGCLLPAGWLVRGLASGDLGADPVKTLTHTTGLTALVILLLTLAITPVRRFTASTALGPLRRPFGLFAFAYATVHFLIYALFDHRLQVAEIAADIAEHPWVLVGFAAFLILLVLAVTSPAVAVRRLGGRRWTRLHRLVYLAALLAVLHFYWLVKKDTREPLRYGGILAALLAARAIPRRTRAPAPPRPAPS
jgi:sulfoxide reductase heme-binding subunit YedZ